MLAKWHQRLAAALLLSLATSQVLAAQLPVAQLDQFIDHLAPHAQSYPPRFDSAEQKAAMVEALKVVLLTLDAASKETQADKEFMFRYAFLNAMGHNLDIEGCSRKTMTAYQTLLTLDPDDKRGNYYFGTFLAGTKLIAKSVPFLQKAIELGEMDAHYPLAVVYLTQKKNAEALAEFKKYLEKEPGNAMAKQMVEKIESGKMDLQLQYVD